MVFFIKLFPTYIVTFPNFISVTTRGPTINDAAIPTSIAIELIAVAVVRWCGGNHTADIKDGPWTRNGPAKPMKNWPILAVLKVKKYVIDWNTAKYNHDTYWVQQKHKFIQRRSEVMFVTSKKNWWNNEKKHKHKRMRKNSFLPTEFESLATLLPIVFQIRFIW